MIVDVTGDDKYKGVTGDTPAADVNYVFPTFVTTRMPIGLVGLIIAAIFAAAMSSIAAELNSLATATVIDIYRRLIKPEASDAHYLRVSKIATLGWGLVACAVATVAVGLGSLIEVVNRFGSIFYGSLLGVFVLALDVQARDRNRRLRRAARGARHGRDLRVPPEHEGDFVPVAQPAGGDRRPGGRRDRQPVHRSRNPHEDAPADRGRRRVPHGVAVLTARRRTVEPLRPARRRRHGDRRDGRPGHARGRRDQGWPDRRGRPDSAVAGRAGRRRVRA